MTDARPGGDVWQPIETCPDTGMVWLLVSPDACIMSIEPATEKNGKLGWLPMSEAGRIAGERAGNEA